MRRWRAWEPPTSGPRRLVCGWKSAARRGARLHLRISPRHTRAAHTRCPSVPGGRANGHPGLPQPGLQETSRPAQASPLPPPPGSPRRLPAAEPAPRRPCPCQALRHGSWQVPPPSPRSPAHRTLLLCREPALVLAGTCSPLPVSSPGGPQRPWVGPWSSLLRPPPWPPIQPESAQTLPGGRGPCPSPAVGGPSAVPLATPRHALLAGLSTQHPARPPTRVLSVQDSGKQPAGASPPLRAEPSLEWTPCPPLGLLPAGPRGNGSWPRRCCWKQQ